jgi:hypothetical protein
MNRLALLTSATFVAICLATSACDPCAGIASCARGDYLAASGQMVDAGTGHGVDGVRLDFIRRGGVEVSADSLTTVSASGGFWDVEFAPSSAGELLVDVRVSPPGEEPYLIRNLALQTRLHGGDANLNQRWVTRLYFNYMGELYYDGTVDTRVANAPVTFRQTGGVALYGPGIRDSVHVTATDFAGRVNLFPSERSDGVFALEESVLFGDLIITLPSGGTSTLKGIALFPTHLYQQLSIIARAPVSP